MAVVRGCCNLGSCCLRTGNYRRAMSCLTEETEGRRRRSGGAALLYAPIPLVHMYERFPQTKQHLNPHEQQRRWGVAFALADLFVINQTTSSRADSPGKTAKCRNAALNAQSRLCHVAPAPALLTRCTCSRAGAGATWNF